MDRRDFLKLMLASSGFPGLVKGNGALNAILPTKDGKKVNFVFVLIDDMGWRDLSCYGSTFYETPNIDQLANDGIKFTDAYASSPVCSPTRASLLTGKYPARLGLTQWIGDSQCPTPYVSQLPLEELTIAESLQQAGYATGFIGKWHLGKKDYYPGKQGFETNIGGYDKGYPPTYFSPYNIPTMDDGPKGEYLTDRHTDDAIEFIRSHQNEPFMLYLSHYAVHAPLEAKKEHVEKYSAKAQSLPKPEKEDLDIGNNVRTRLVQNNANFAGMVESTDDSVGRIIDVLRELHLEDNTAIIFTSDNGCFSTVPTSCDYTASSCLPLRAGKGWLYEGGIRVPLIIKWPGVTTPGTVCGEPVTSTDLYPTILQVAGLRLRPGQHADGISLVPLLKGQQEPSREAIYWHYPHYHGSGSRPAGAVRCGDYKLIEFYEDNRIELYNLRNDIGEQHNLADEEPEKVKQLKDMLYRWRERVNAKMPSGKDILKAKERFERDCLRIK